MISIISVFNDKAFLEENLLATLSNQLSGHELIVIDNIDHKFTSAASALNYGAEQATGNILMFVHQDMRLLENNTLSKIEAYVNSLPDFGIGGVIGLSMDGHIKGYILNTFEKLGTPYASPEEVQTLDECVLIIKKEIFHKIRFDEQTLDGWHLYGVDFCLAAQKSGLKAYVLPIITHHFSLATNYDQLLEYQKRILDKYKAFVSPIYTTCGKLATTSLFRKWFKQKFVEPFRSPHPLSFFNQQFNRADVCSVLGLTPPRNISGSRILYKK